MTEKSNQEYEWEPFDVRRLYAEKLDHVLPQHDMPTTKAWIEFAEELADGVETTFAIEAESLVTAFKEISDRYSPQAVAAIYQTIHMPNNALLAHEILAAAEYAEQGMTSSELSDMAQRGEFEGGPRQNSPTEGFSFK
ncbi:MAG: hypothetical protein HFF04_02260 [Oscillospiraceae bacterium]|jgi:hypothetical protein|nr:hypothetical protein [Oscillospiraceae bacterium]